MNKVSTKLKLYFKDGEKAQRTVSVDYPKASYEESDIKTAMDNIITSNTLRTKKAPIKTKTKAELESISRLTYNVE